MKSFKYMSSYIPSESESSAETLKELKVTGLRQDFAFAQLNRKQVRVSSGKNRGEKIPLKSLMQMQGSVQVLISTSGINTSLWLHKLINNFPFRLSFHCAFIAGLALMLKHSHIICLYRNF